MEIQRHWYRCRDCSALFYAPPDAPDLSAGTCTYGQPHRAADPLEEYALEWEPTPTTGSHLWRACAHCQALFHAVARDPNLGSRCPGRDGPHESVDGWAFYRIPLAPEADATTWSGCTRCARLIRDDGWQSPCGPFTELSRTHTLGVGRLRPEPALSRFGLAHTVVAPTPAATVAAATGAPSIVEPPATRLVAFRRRVVQYEHTTDPAALIDLAHPALDGQPHAVVSVTPDISFPRGELAPPPVVRAVLYLDRDAVLHGGGNAHAPRDRWYVWLDRAVEGMTLNVVAAVPEGHVPSGMSG